MMKKETDLPGLWTGPGACGASSPAVGSSPSVDPAASAAPTAPGPSSASTTESHQHSSFCRTGSVFGSQVTHQFEGAVLLSARLQAALAGLHLLRQAG